MSAVELVGLMERFGPGAPAVEGIDRRSGGRIRQHGTPRDRLERPADAHPLDQERRP